MSGQPRVLLHNFAQAPWISQARLNPEKSFLAWAATPEYPALWHLKGGYERIRLYRRLSFGPATSLCQPTSAHERSDFLNEGYTNLGAPCCPTFPAIARDN